VVSILKDPHFQHALARVKIGRCPEDVQKNRLRHVFGFTRVAHNAGCHTGDQTMIPVKNNSQGVLPAGWNQLHQFIIGERMGIPASQGAQPCCAFRVSISQMNLRRQELPPISASQLHG
jgi:hypothetical protein